MAAGGDVLFQCLEELRDLRQQVHEGESRTAEQLNRVKEDVGVLQRSVSTLAGNLSTLADGVHFTRQTHERYFDKIGRTLNVFADLQSRNRDQLDDHERRLKLLENR